MTSGIRSSGSSGPAPTTSRRSASWTASTVASPTGRPDARSASATRCGVTSPASRARCSRTSSTRSVAPAIRRRWAVVVAERGQHAGGCPAQRSAARPDRPEPEVDRLCQAALVGHPHQDRALRRAASGTRRRSRRRAPPDPADRGRSRRPQMPHGGGDPGHRRHHRDQHVVAAGDDLIDQRIGRPRQVDHHRVVTTPGRGEGLAGDEGLQPPRLRTRRTSSGRRHRRASAGTRAGHGRSAGRWCGPAPPSGRRRPARGRAPGRCRGPAGRRRPPPLARTGRRSGRARRRTSSRPSHRCRRPPRS